MNDDSDRQQSTDEEAPIEAKLVEDDGFVVASIVDENPLTAHASDVRTGSPFAVDPVPLVSAPVRNPGKKEVIYDVGPLRYTAIGAVSATLMVLVFALAAVWYFPGGGSMIAALGCSLAMFGLYSPKQYRLTATVCLVLHLVLFLLCFARSMTV